MTTPLSRLKTLGLALPTPPSPVAAYVPGLITGDLIYVSGQIPFRDGTLLATGPVPSSTTLEAAQDAARQCVLNGLAVIHETAPDGLDSVAQIVRVGVFVASDPGFRDQPRVANGASELLQDVFGEAGRHARAAVGCIALPLGSTVEVEMIARLG